MSNTIGEALSRLVEASGADTKRACYQGDVGMHVASAIWGKRKDPSLSWGKAYALGATTYKNGTDAEKAEIVALNKTIYTRTDDTVNALHDGGREESLRYFEGIYAKLGTRFDHYFFESKSGTFGKEVVEKHMGTVFEKSEGAVIYKGDESKGLHTRVFINKEGLPTYEAKELGLAKIKHDAYNYDHSVVVTANEVNDYFRVLLDAMAKVFPDLAAKTEHIGHGVMKLPTGKMSSRTGDVITAESMIADVKAKVLEKMKENDMKDKDQVAEDVAIAAIKYSILRQAPGKDIIWDVEQATNFEGDSGPYLQYTHARTSALLRKGKEMGISPDIAHTESGSLARILARFSDIVLRAQRERAPQYVATYLTLLAQEFNSYYGNTHILDEKDKEGSGKRLGLAAAVGNTLRSGLWMLGMKAPEAM
jgi:arginyl-tRNA synthetase